MKKFLIYLTCFAVLLSVAAFAPTPRQVVHAAETTTSVNRIVVNGVGEVMVEPDIAKTTVAISSNSENISTAENENASAVDRVINVLINAGVTEDNVKTTSYTIYERAEKRGETETTIYNVCSVLEFKTSANSDLEVLIQKLTEAGVNQVYGIRYEVSDTNNHYNMALTKAVNNAKAKASTIFNGNNFKIVEVIEAPCGSCDVMPLSLARSNGFQKGAQIVSAYVKVIFEAV